MISTMATKTFLLPENVYLAKAVNFFKLILELTTLIFLVLILLNKSRVTL